VRGIPTYTQHTVAWGNRVPLQHGVNDEIGVSFDAFGGGTHGEFRFVWRELGAKYQPNGALQVQCFSDGLGAMLDERLLSLLRKVARLRQRDRDLSPARLVELLEQAGVRPSEPHLRGKNEPTYGRPAYWPDADRRAFERLRKHAEGRRAA